MQRIDLQCSEKVLAPEKKRLRRFVMAQKKIEVRWWQVTSRREHLPGAIRVV